MQIDRLASRSGLESSRPGRKAAIPDGGYHGAYLEEAAAEVLARGGRTSRIFRRRRESPVPGVASVQREEQNRDFADFGVKFDVITSEQVFTIAACWPTRSFCSESRPHV